MRVCGPVAMVLSWLFASTVFGPIALAQTAQTAYPARAIRLIVPFPAGGTTDIVARMVARKLDEAWGQPVIVENRPGATGSLAAVYVKDSPPDGYTLLLGTASVNTVNPSFRNNLPFDTLKDFAPVSLLVTFPNMLVVHPSVQANTVAELVQILRASEGKYNYASGGVGTSNHLAMEAFMQKTGTKMVHVPYAGSAPAINDLIAGHVTIMFDNMTSVLPHVQSGKMRGLAVAGQQRVSALPALPAIGETVPGFEATSWVGILAPQATPEAIIEKIAAACRSLLKDEAFVDKIRTVGAEVATSSKAEFAEFIRKDLQKWRETVSTANIRPN